MSDTKFTKGEWKIHGERVGVIDKSDTQSYGMMLEVAFVDMYNFGECEGEANANLIASAPEMYEALLLIDQADKMISEGVNVHGGMSMLQGQISMISEILAKARGESV